jgi:hypothetical protein
MNTPTNHDQFSKQDHDSLFSMNVDKTNALLFVADKLNIGSNNKRSAFFEDHL